MSAVPTRSGPRRWHEQRWLFDSNIASLGIEFDQNRLRYSLGPVRDKTCGADIAMLKASVSKLADLTPVASAQPRGTSGSPSARRTAATRRPPECTGSRRRSCGC